MAGEKKFKLVTFYFQTGLWSKDMVKNAVKKRWITREEYKTITGEEYKI